MNSIKDSEDERIEFLNEQIVKNKKRIKNLEIRDDIIFIISEVASISLLSAISYRFHDEASLPFFAPVLAISFFTAGAIPSINLPTKKTMKKISNYHMEIKNCIDELHAYALEEDQKIMINKKCDIIKL